MEQWNNCIMEMKARLEKPESLLQAIQEQGGVEAADLQKAVDDLQSRISSLSLLSLKPSDGQFVILDNVKSYIYIYTPTCLFLYIYGNFSIVC